MTGIYLDNAATTPMSEEVIKTMTTEMTNDFGNPSSTHEFGRKAQRVINNARQEIAQVINAQENEIIFTSGGSESNNSAIMGTAFGRQKIGKKIITTKIEHPSVLNPLKRLEKLGFEVVYLNVDQTGSINLDELKKELTDDTILVSIMAVNNEVGTIMPLSEIGELVKKSNAYFHVDAVQALGNIDLDVQKMQIDLLSTSAHKINGPKFMGFLYKSKEIKLSPLILGGEQELKRRAGTENTPAIAGFGVAVKQIAKIDKHKLQQKYKGFQDIILEKLTDAGVKFEVNGGRARNSSHHLLNIHFNGISTTIMQTKLDLAGFAVSGGSACTAGSLEPSHVLIACFGVDSARVNESIRISFGQFTTNSEVTAFASELVKITHGLQQ